MGSATKWPSPRSRAEQPTTGGWRSHSHLVPHRHTQAALTLTRPSLYQKVKSLVYVIWTTPIFGTHEQQNGAHKEQEEGAANTTSAPAVVAPVRAAQKAGTCAAAEERQEGLGSQEPKPCAPGTPPAKTAASSPGARTAGPTPCKPSPHFGCWLLLPSPSPLPLPPIPNPKSPGGGQCQAVHVRC